MAVELAVVTYLVSGRPERVRQDPTARKIVLSERVDHLITARSS